MKLERSVAFVAATVGICLAATGNAETLFGQERLERTREIKVAAPLTFSLIERVRKATSRFEDVSTAIEEGYRPIPCVSGANGGAMGIHYVNSRYLTEDNNSLDIAKPEAVLYEPQMDGSLELVGVEYVTFEGPAALEGHLLHHHGSPNRYGLDPYYELHVWAHRENPAGPFVGMNTAVSCEFAGG